jgi:hypothetical protein
MANKKKQKELDMTGVFNRVEEENTITPEEDAAVCDETKISFNPITLVPFIMNTEILQIIDKIVNAYPEYTFYIDFDESEDMNHKVHNFNRTKNAYGIVTYNPYTPIKYHNEVSELICYHYR